MESVNQIKHHSHHHQNFQGAEALGVTFFLNLTFQLIEIAGRLWTNRVAILADAMHDTVELLSLGLAWFSRKLPKKRGINVFHAIMDVCHF